MRLDDPLLGSAQGSVTGRGTVASLGHGRCVPVEVVYARRRIRRASSAPIRTCAMRGNTYFSGRGDTRSSAFGQCLACQYARTRPGRALATVLALVETL